MPIPILRLLATTCLFVLIARVRAASTGNFLDKNGKILGSDGKNDGSLYVIRTVKKLFPGQVQSSRITRCERHRVNKFIRLHREDKAAFDANQWVYFDVQEINGHQYVRQKMVEIVSADDGRGGTGDQNNREYWGTVAKNDSVVKGHPGPVMKPGKEIPLDLTTFENTVEEFHSHPSGDTTDPAKLGAGDAVKVGGEKENFPNSYTQSPSQLDIKNIGDIRGYVFGLKNKTVYIYTKAGVSATVALNHFVRYSIDAKK
jgi:hypothetical protein